METIQAKKTSCRVSWKSSSSLFFVLFLSLLTYKSISLLPLLPSKTFSLLSSSRTSSLSLKRFNFSSTSSSQWTPLHSFSSQSSPITCEIPQLDPFAPEMMRHFKPRPQLDCGDKNDWVFVSRGRLWFRTVLAQRHPDFRCNLTAILRSGDFGVALGATVTDFDNGTRMPTDSVFVGCRDGKGAEFKAPFLSISRRSPKNVSLLRQRLLSPAGRLLPAPVSAESSPRQQRRPPDVVFLIFDSLSYGAWRRYLPKSTKYFVEKSKGVLLKGYNIVGDGTIQALLPILTGHTVDELPEARRGFPAAKPVDDHPWIWKEFSSRGYMTSYTEETPPEAAFQYSMLGFKNPPTDIYGRPYYLAKKKYPELWKAKNSECVGELHPFTAGLLNLAREHFLYLPDIPKFAVLFENEYSHNHNELSSTLDSELLQFLVESEEERRLDNTLFIMLSDHGCRIGKARATEIGKIEERKPLVGFRFPPWFREQHPEKFANFVANAKTSLVTPFDIHATLHHLLDLRADRFEINHHQPERGIRAVSLFQLIGNRTCAQAHIEPHWCACLQWKALPLNATIVPKLINESLAFLNSLTKKVRDQCVNWTLPRVISVRESAAPEEMRRFKTTKFAGSTGVEPVMTENTKKTVVLYQVRLIVRPSEVDSPPEAAFELSLRLNGDSLKADEKSVSRLDRYGDQPACVASKFPHLRKYCYCRVRRG